MWRFLKKLQIELPYDPAIPLLGIHTEEIRIERDTCTPMFIAALFIIARTWKQPRCPSADEWIRKLWCIYSMEYYSCRFILHLVPARMCAKLVQSCLTRCNPTDCSPAKLLCPWDSPGKNTGVGCHFLLQQITPTQGWNPSLLCLLRWQADSLPLVPPGKPTWFLTIHQIGNMCKK